MSSASVESIKSPTGQSSDLNTTTSRALPKSAQQGVSTQIQTKQAVQLGPSSETNVTASQASPPAAHQDMSANAPPQKSNKRAKEEEALPISSRKAKSRSKISASATSDKSTCQIPPPQVARTELSPHIQVAPTALNAQPPRTGTHWPESKKAALSSAAVKTLAAIPENAGKSITTEFINGILDKNPSYIELCQILESMGFTLDRARFAKNLLAAVPDPSPRTSQSTLHTPSSMQPAAHPSHSEPASAQMLQTHSTLKTTDTNINDSTQKERKGPKKLAGRSPGRPRKDGTPAQPRTKGVGAQDSPSHLMQSSTSSQNMVLKTPVSVDQRLHDRMLTSQTTRHDDLDLSYADLLESVSAKKQNSPGSQQVFTGTPVTSQNSATRKQKKSIGSVNLAGSRADQVTAKAMPGTSRRPSTVNASENRADLSNGIVAAAASSTTTPTQRQTQTDAAPKSQAAPQIRTMSKAEAARKRTFAEIVDLTEDISDDDDIYSTRIIKSPRIDGQTVASRMTVAGPQGNGHSQGNKQALNNEGATPLPGQGPSTSLSAIQAKHHSLSGRELVRSFKREQALRRSTYDPRTIARDVLIASGRHPRMRGLNEHLDLLKQSFPSVTNSSDLDTFRWDIVDPDEATPGIGKDCELNKQRPRKNKLQVVDIASADLSTGKKKVQADQPRGASTGTDVVQNPAEAGGAVDDVPAASGKSREIYSRLPGNGTECFEFVASMFNMSTKTSLTLSQKRRREPESESDSGPFPPMIPSGVQSVHKRTRLSSASHNASSNPVASRGGTNTSSRHTMRLSSVSIARNSGTAGQSTSNKTQSNVVSSHKKTRKNSNYPQGSSKNFAVVIDSSPNKGKSSVSAKGSGQKANAHSAPVGDDEWAPIPMPIYRCRWANCQAELHNIDLLRRHVLKVHKPTATHGPFHCSWKGCMKVVKDSNNNGVPIHQPYVFGSEKSWFEHVNKRHIEEYGWKYGDGPFAGRIGQSTLMSCVF